MKITTSYHDKIKAQDRIEPRHFYYDNKISKVLSQNGHVSVQEIASIKSGSTPEHSSEKKNPNDHIFVKSADIKRYQINYNTLSFIKDEIFKKRTAMYLQEEDVLVFNTGKYLGFSTVVPEDITDATTNQNVLRIRINEKDKMRPYYMMGFINSKFGQAEIDSLLTLTGQKYLNSSKMYQFKIPFLDEEKMDKIDKLLREAELFNRSSMKHINEAKEYFYKKSNIDFENIKDKLVFSTKINSIKTGDLWTPNYSRPLFLEAINKIKERYKTVTLSEIADIDSYSEPGSDTYILYEDREKTDIPFIRTSDIVNYEVDLFPDFFVSQRTHKINPQDIRKGDILYNNDGKIGYPAMLTESDNVMLQSHIKRIRLKNEAIEEFNLTQEYLFLMLTIKEIAEYQASKNKLIQSTIPTLSKRLNDYLIPIMEKEDIKHITNLVRDAFIMKEEKKRILLLVNRMFDEEFTI